MTNDFFIAKINHIVWTEPHPENFPQWTITDIFDNYEAIVFDHKFRDVGTITINAPLTAENVDLLSVNNLIIHGTKYVPKNIIDFAGRGDETFSDFGVIVNVQIDESEGTITAKAKSGEHLLKSRIVPEYGVTNKNIYPTFWRVSKFIFDKAFHDWDVAGGYFNIGLYGDDVTSPIGYSVPLESYAYSYQTPYSLFEAYTETAEHAFYSTTDSGLMIYTSEFVRVLWNNTTKRPELVRMHGLNRSSVPSGVTNPPEQVILRQDFGHIFETSIERDIEDFANVALVFGEGEGSARTKLEVNPMIDGTDPWYYGADIREIYVDAKDLKSADYPSEPYGNEYWYRLALYQRGLTKLVSQADTIEFSIDSNSAGIRFRENLYLSDVVSVQLTDYVRANYASMITGATETFDSGGYNLVIAAGQPLETLSARLNKRYK